MIWIKCSKTYRQRTTRHTRQHDEAGQFAQVVALHLGESKEAIDKGWQVRRFFSPLGRQERCMWLSGAFRLMMSIYGLGANFPLINERCVALAATSDIHGQVFPISIPQGPTQHTTTRSGLLIYSAYLARLQQLYGEGLMIVDSGDSYHGSLAHERSHGALIHTLLNHLPLTATTLGNHDWWAFEQRSEHHPTACQQLAHHIEQSTYPWLAVNLQCSNPCTLGAHFKPWHWLTLNGINIVMTGVASVGAKLPCPDLAWSMEPLPSARSLLPWVQQWRQQGADLVVLLIHAGDHCGGYGQMFDLRQCPTQRSTPLRDWLAQFPRGTFDIVVAGHTHGHIHHWWQDTYIMQSGAYLQHFHWAELCFDQQGNWRRDWSTFHPHVPLDGSCWPQGPCQGPKEEGLAQVHHFLGAPLAIPNLIQQALLPWQSHLDETLPIALELPLAPQRLAQHVAQALHEHHPSAIGIYPISGVRRLLPAGPLQESALAAALPFHEQVVRYPTLGHQLLRWQQQLSFARHPVWAIAGPSSPIQPKDGQDGIGSPTQPPILPDKLYWCVTTERLWRNAALKLPQPATHLTQWPHLPIVTSDVRTLARAFLAQHYPIKPQGQETTP